MNRFTLVGIVRTLQGEVLEVEFGYFDGVGDSCADKRSHGGADEHRLPASAVQLFVHHNRNVINSKLCGDFPIGHFNCNLEQFAITNEYFNLSIVFFFEFDQIQSKNRSHKTN